MSNPNGQWMTRVINRLEKSVIFESLASLLIAKAKVFPENVNGRIGDTMNCSVPLGSTQKIKSDADGSPK